MHITMYALVTEDSHCGLRFTIIQHEKAAAASPHKLLVYEIANLCNGKVITMQFQHITMQLL